jgi:capsular polysaccharide transport system permease protein
MTHDHPQEADARLAAMRAVSLPIAAAMDALAAAPGDEAARVHLASLLLIAGETQLGEAVLLPAWRGADSSAIVARALSGAWMLLGQQARALEAARIAADAAPGEPEIQSHLAGLLLRAGHPAPALFAAGRGVGADPEAHQAWRLASSALLELGHAEEAVAAANRAARLSPLHGDHAEQIRTAIAGDLAPPARPDAQGHAVPAWARLPDTPPRPAPPPLRAAIAARLRIVQALLLRETRTQVATSRLGYAWSLVEPMSHVVLLSAVFIFLGHDAQPPIGDSMLQFYMSGVLAFLFFAHLTERAMDLPANSRPLLLVPAIGLFDVLAGRAVLSAATDLVVAVLTCALLIALGAGALPAHPGRLLGCYAMLFLLAFGIACLNVVMSSHSTAWERLWPSFLRVQYFTCGVFYHPLDMPEELRGLILLNPLVHVTEWMREGYYPDYASPFLDTAYLARCTIAAMALGIVVLAASARRLRQHG